MNVADRHPRAAIKAWLIQDMAWLVQDMAGSRLADLRHG
jgi:hypothetical protein